MGEATSYFMDDPREAKRLTDKVNASAWVSKFFSPLIDYGSCVLDVGCGPGVLATATAISHPSSHVTGIDLSAERFKAVLDSCPKNLKLKAGDAQALPFGASSFELVYSRFLLEYLANKEKAVTEMVRVCKPGGRVLLQDLDGQLIWHYPEDAELQSQIERVIAGLGTTGFDPLVGRKLFSLAKRAGLTDIQVSAESYHLYAGAIDIRNRGLWEIKLDIAMPVAAKVLGSDSAAQALKSRFLDYLDRDDTLTYSVLFSVTGKKDG